MPQNIVPEHRLVRVQALRFSRHGHLGCGLNHLTRVRGHGHLPVAHDQLALCSGLVDPGLLYAAVLYEMEVGSEPARKSLHNL